MNRSEIGRRRKSAMRTVQVHQNVTPLEEAFRLLVEDKTLPRSALERLTRESRAALLSLAEKNQIRVWLDEESPSYRNFAPVHPKRVFLSYRRKDTQDLAARVHRDLVARYGHDSIFFDDHSIPKSVDFRAYIVESIRFSDTFIALIGDGWVSPNWVGKVKAPAKDYVALEIEEAVNARTPILPVLVDGAVMPDSALVPKSFENFTMRNAVSISRGRRYRRGLLRITREIDRLLSACEAQNK